MTVLYQYIYGSDIGKTLRVNTISMLYYCKSTGEVSMEFEHKILERIIFIYTLLFIVVGLLMQTPKELLQGLTEIVSSSGILISDYMVIGGIGPALVNAGLVGLIGLILIRINKVPMVGASIAAIFTMIGFGLFGKNILTIFPSLFGVYLYSRYTRKEFKAYIFPALYGTALAPIVSEVAINSPFGILGGVLAGIAGGLIVPALAPHLLAAHEGHNLYNIGFTAGFAGLFIINLLRGFSFEPETLALWGTTFNTPIRWLTFGMLVSMIITGFILNGKSFKGYTDIFEQAGTAITDFVEIMGVGNTLINMGIVGLIGMLYIELVGGDYNGATLGGILTMVGFAAFGKQPKNIYPVMLGVYLGSVFSVFNANDPGPLLAALFVTTIAPLAGRYGALVGILAGFVHLSVVNFTGVLHGGLNLYNNGFTAGLVATIFIGVIKGYTERD